MRASRYLPDLDLRIDHALTRAARFLSKAQQHDGGFMGRWGICFTYGTWFGIWGLLACGTPPEDPRIRRACRFLLTHQQADGSWGETPESCLRGTYTQHPQGQAVMTSWALLALTRAGMATHPAARQAVRFLVTRQRPDGCFAAESYAGACLRTLALNYGHYRHYFPMWALAEWTATKNNSSGLPSSA